MKKERIREFDIVVSHELKLRSVIENVLFIDSALIKKKKIEKTLNSISAVMMRLTRSSTCQMIS